MSDLVPPEDLPELARLSARIGADPLLIQAAGGNTSVKDGGTMWIKASGTQLAEALTREIFVPVDLASIDAAMADPDVDADRTEAFLVGDQALRPSIETSLHAVFPQRVVVHVHCVNTIAVAIRKDAEAVLTERLAAYDWCFVPYIKPGANLAAQVRKALGPATDVVVLQNHGLIVAAETVGEVEALLDHVVTSHTAEPAPAQQVDLVRLESAAGDGWRVPPEDASIHQVALEPAWVKMATTGSLYPDHVLFCGIAATVLDDALPEASGAPPFLLVPGAGVIMQSGASAAAEALTTCLGDVLTRVPTDAELTYLTFEQNMELLDWDAEKYRLALNA